MADLDKGVMMQTILAVDDTPENLDVLRVTFGTKFRVKVVTDGLRALEVARADPPDIILLDIMMPGMDGFEVCRELKADPRTARIPVIFVTALGDEASQQKGLELGAVDYIQKPINPILAQIRVKNQLAMYDHQRQLELAVKERTAELEHTRMQIILRLSRAAEYKDNETGTHILRMSHYSRLLALHLSLGDSMADLIFNAAPMHDIGKIGVPDRIMLKPGKLDAEEWVIMHKHPELGASIIGTHSDPLLKAAREIALYHHEKWDGTGYPAKLSGDAIPMLGRIVALADVFDALTSARPYKSAWPLDQAVEWIVGQSGSHFDPAVVAAFEGALPEMDLFRINFPENEGSDLTGSLM